MGAFLPVDYVGMAQETLHMLHDMYLVKLHLVHLHGIALGEVMAFETCGLADRSGTAHDPAVTFEATYFPLGQIFMNNRPSTLYYRTRQALVAF
jgi:hypothetical protein